MNTLLIHFMWFNQIGLYWNFDLDELKQIQHLFGKIIKDLI